MRKLRLAIIRQYTLKWLIHNLNPGLYDSKDEALYSTRVGKEKEGQVCGDGERLDFG